MMTAGMDFGKMNVLDDGSFILCFRLLTDFEESSGCVKNNPSAYSTVCIEYGIISLAVTALVQSNHINDIDGTSSYVAFHAAQQTSLQVSYSCVDCNIYMLFKFPTIFNRGYMNRTWFQMKAEPLYCHHMMKLHCVEQPL